ncbi:Unknown protein [Striga hermonthica]|uniref:Uncharacterized protein n=1 Tax=Striga hermonthica TaxID=68872 RepID=A0A9N7MWN8_STRHE|nr:Unknown protein [Striga hermonthica]
MEVAIIDWKSIDSRFVKDELYEHINAPKWVDFSAPDQPLDDDAWFCRSSCKHPKTAEDFLNEEKRTPNSSSKHRRSVSVSDIPPLGDKLKRDATLKKRGLNQPFGLSNKGTKHNRDIEDGENQDPNLSTPTNHKSIKAGKEAIKSSADNKPTKDNPMMKNERAPKLRSTLSARNLFSGGDTILSKVAEFCNDLKKLAVRARGRENLDYDDAKSQQGAQDRADENLDALNDQEKERKPLLELNKEKSEVLGTSSASTVKLRRKKNGDGENTPIGIDVKGQESVNKLLHIRTYPPTPQCFSAGQGHSTASTPKPSRIRPPLVSFH